MLRLLHQTLLKTIMKDIIDSFLKLLLIIYICLETLVVMLIPKSLRYKDVKGETVLITGGGSGLGRQLALRFAALGCRVVVWDVNEKGNKETVELATSKGGDCCSYVCDVTKREMVYAVSKKVKDEVGHVTILINNAGIATGKRMLDCPDHLIEKTFKVNTIAHCWTCKSFLPYMMARNRGHIVTIASFAGLVGTPNLADYSASKFGAVGFHEALSFELKRESFDGIKMTLVCPIFINTGLFEGASNRYFSIMAADKVADEIISSVLANEEFVTIPRIIRLLLPLKYMLPRRAVVVLYEALKVDTVMNSFVGRPSKME